MRILTHILLLVFVAFLATPTIVCVISETVDTSYFYSVAEEELAHKELRTFKEVLNLDHLFNFTSADATLIISENFLKHDNITPSIFSPPPNV